MMRKKRIVLLLLALAACLALTTVALAKETETRYLWQADDDGKIYWSTTIPSGLAASDGGTALAESTPTLNTSVSYPVYRLPEGSYQLLEDITLNGTLLAYDDITLDLDGYVLALSETATSGSIINMQEGNLTLKSSDTGSEHKVDTSGDVWKLAASDAMGDDITIVEGGVLAGGKGMNTTTGSDAVSMGGAVCVLSGDFTMENCNIVGCTAGTGGAVYVRQLSGCSFTFTMTGSRIMGCKASGAQGSSRGGAVYSGAAFTMSDSVIEACKSVSYGGGIYVSNTVTLKSGSEIKNCTASNGGGAYVYNNGGLQMEVGAVIENCTATGSEGGGGVYLSEGSGEQHKMAGTITGCKADKNGGGVYYNFQNGRELTISGTIEKCSAANGGGVYFPANNTTPSRTVILKGGTITGCTATGNGGGVYVDGNKLLSSPNTFELDSGSITGCTATNGGGVYLGCDSSASTAPVFTMGGGSITGCNATQYGGGVYAGNYDGSLNSTVTLKGGEIKGNNAVSNGGGIYVDTSNLTVRGSVTVTDNVSGGTKDESTGVYVKGESGTANNIFLPDSYTLYFLYVSGGQVGFSFQDGLSEGKRVAEGGNTASFSYCVFDGDDDNEWALYEEDGAYLAGKNTVLLTHGDDSTGYVKFNAAYDAAADGDTIKLLADATMDKDIEKDLTIQLNDHELKDSLYINSTVTIEGTGTVNWLRVDGTSADVTLKGGVTITTIVNVTGGELTVENAEIKDTLYADSCTLTMSGGSAKNLNVYPNSTVTLSGGTFGSISRMALTNEQNPTLPGTDYSKTPTFGAMLGEGCGFRTTDAWYDKYDNSDETSISNVEVKKLPITSVSITTTEYKTSYAYGETVNLSATVTTPTAYTGEIGFQWYLDNTGRVSGNNNGGKTTIDSYYEENLDVGSHTFRIEVTIDGYTAKSDTLTVNIAKATIGSGTYPAVKANSLTYNGTAQELISFELQTEFGSYVEWKKRYSGAELMCKADNDNWYESADYATATNAGKHTVYWYLEGGTNYESIGTAANPESIEVTIAPKPVTPTVMVANGRGIIYNGKEQKPAVLVMDDTTTIPESEYTVSYGSNINAGENAGSVTVTCKEGGNYTWTEPVTQNFTIQKATAPTGVSATEAKIVYTAVPYTVDLSTVITGMPTDAGTVSYSLPGDVTDASISGNTLTISDKISGTVGASIDVPVTVSSDNYDDASVTVAIKLVDKEKKTLTDLSLTGWTYGETENEPSYTKPEDATNLKVEYKGQGAEDSAYTDTVPYNAGSYTVRVSYETNTAFWSGTADFTIGKAQASVANGPSEATVTYNGEDQALLSSGGSTDDGTMQYSLNQTDWSGAIPSARNVGSYTVYYRVEGDSNHTNSEISSVTSKIEPRNLTSTLAADSPLVFCEPQGSLFYNGTPQTPTFKLTLRSRAESGSAGDVQSVLIEELEAGRDYEVSVTPQTNVGEGYEIVFTGKGNYTGTAASKWSIAKGELPESSYPDNLTGYKGRALSSVELPDGWTWVNGDTVLSTDQSTYAANYAGSSNYNEKSNVTLTVNVSVKEPKTLTVSMDGWTYGETAKTPSYTKATGAGETVISYKSKGAEDYTYRRSVPTAAGEYTVQVSYETATEIWSGTADFAIAKATPTGAPGYTAITTSGKTLADANLTANESWPAGTLKWVGSDGSELDSTTTVAVNTAYSWQFTPTDTDNYNPASGSVTLWSYTPPAYVPPTGSTTTETVTVPVSSDHDTVHVEATVSKGNATIEVSDQQIEKVAADHAGEVTLDVSGLKNVESATVPSHVVEKTNEAENTGLTVALPAGSVSLDETALESVTENAKGEDVTVSVVAVPTSKLPTAVKDIIGMEPTVVAVVDVNILINGKKQSSFDGGKVTISVPYTPKKGEDTSKLTVWFIRDDGKIENRGGYYDAKNQCFVFETDHLSQYLLVNTNGLVSFTDVAANAYYATAVSWAVNEQITGGVGNNQFAPDASCTRAQAVTFLWRAMGCPKADTQENPFTDVAKSSYYYDAVLWAVENGITTGTSSTTFSPDASCTRGQIVTFLHRAQNAPAGSSENPFIDVKQTDYCANAVLWAVENGITTGTGKSTFSPDASCTRAQIVTFLYRLFG